MKEHCAQYFDSAVVGAAAARAFVAKSEQNDLKYPGNSALRALCSLGDPHGWRPGWWPEDTAAAPLPVWAGRIHDLLCSRTRAETERAAGRRMQARVAPRFFEAATAGQLLLPSEQMAALWREKDAISANPAILGDSNP
jgi:hypothetical protein